MLPATAFVLILTRVSAVVFTSPVLGAKSVPLRFRVVLSCLLSLAVIPIAAHAPSISTTGDFLNALFSEMVVGVMLGLGVTIMFVAAQAAANVIGQMAGMQWTNPADDVLGPAATPLSQLFGVISLAAFALIGGPELVISALLETLAQLPLGSSLRSLDAVQLLSQILQQSFLLTLRGVGPAVAALMISTTAIGLISRTYPQMNTFGLSLTSNQVVMFLAVFLTLGGCVWLFVDDLGGVVNLIQARLRQMQI